MKATALAHPIQGLIKYHGLKDKEKRIPFHDSISVCLKALQTITTVETLLNQRQNTIIINKKKIHGKDQKRVEVVLNQLSKIADYKGCFKIVSINSQTVGKGLGFSASGFAALGLAASEALGLKLDYTLLSEVVRLGAGSATRSLAGSFAIWHANKNGRSFAEPLPYPKSINFTVIVVPIASSIRTDEAHAEVLSSPLFEARLKKINVMIKRMKNAIRKGDVSTIGQLAEEDTLNLHAITMTGKSRLILWEPETLQIIREIIQLRKEGTEAYYSMDTGPSVFINTLKENKDIVIKRLQNLGFKKVIESEIGGKPRIISQHLF
jgi:phosphomevalonate decarboxylase